MDDINIQVFVRKVHNIYRNLLVCPTANMNNTCNTHTHIMGNTQYMKNDTLQMQSRYNTQASQSSEKKQVTEIQTLLHT